MNKLFFLGVFLLLASTQAFAKVGIPIGSREVLEKVHDLPDTDEYKNGSTYVDIGRLHKEFNVAYFLPLWIQEEPKLVLIEANNKDAYYDIKKEDMDAILKENNLDGEKLNKLDFYTRYGGKLVAVAIIGVLVWSGLSRKGKNEDQ